MRHKFKTRRVIVGKIDDQWQADLVDMQKLKSFNNNINYILTIIDIFSKHAWAIPIKKKTGEEITKAFTNVFKERKPEKLQTDKGLEFINKQTKALFEKHNIKWFTTENETKAQVVERFNRTIKEKMFKYFTHYKTKKCIDILNKLLLKYNNSFHRSIKMTPNEASKLKNSSTVYKNLYPTSIVFSIPKYQEGDKVRISKKRKTFRKGYLPNFTEEVFIISKVLVTEPPTYQLKDMDGEDIIGSFYETEIVKYGEEDVFEIEKVLKETKNKLYVKWKGYKKHTWVDKKHIV